MKAKINLTLDDIEPAADVIAKALPSHLKVLFTDVIDTMTGGNQEIYNTVGFGIGISRRVAGYWGISEYSRAVLAWHLENYEPVPDTHPLHLRRISDVVEEILQVAVTTPGETRKEKTQSLVIALHDWATATYEA